MGSEERTTEDGSTDTDDGPSADADDGPREYVDDGPPTDPDIDDLLTKLETLERTVDADHERRKVRQTISLVNRMPGSEAFTKRIGKYTGRDVAESFVGAVVFSLPLLVEDGVFQIAEWFTSAWVGPIPVFMAVNVAFVLTLTGGLIYWADFRQVEVRNPILGFLPRRYVGTLLVSLLTAYLMMIMWGRLTAADPTAVEALARVTVIWAAAALGAALGDILPGESKGENIGDRLGDFGDSFGHEAE